MKEIVEALKTLQNVCNHQLECICCPCYDYCITEPYTWKFAETGDKKI